MRKRLVISVILAIILLGVSIIGFSISFNDYSEPESITVMTIDEFLDMQEGEVRE